MASKRGRSRDRMDRWHLRKIQNVNGTVMVSIPSRVIKNERRRHADPWRWEPGGYARVGVTPEGRLVMCYESMDGVEGYVSGETLRDADKASEYLGPAPMPKSLRNKVRRRVWGDSGVEEERWVDATDEVFVPKSEMSWSDEVAAWRRYMGWKQYECARAVGVTPVTWNRWENGKSEPRDGIRKDVVRDKMRLLKKTRAEGEV